MSRRSAVPVVGRGRTVRDAPDNVRGHNNRPEVYEQRLEDVPGRVRAVPPEHDH